jgi:protein-disulfide isomerase
VTNLKSILLAGCAVVLGLTSVAHAETKPAFSDDQRAAMQDVIRNFILDNPEVLMESVNRFRDKEQQKKEESSVKVLKENMSFLTNGKHPQIGNPKGDITVVEFFDYNCGYCKHALKSVQELTEKDKNVKVLFMEFPILSPTSAVASKWAVAANMQGKYWEFHQATLESTAPKDDENLAKIAKSVGMDVEKAKKDAAGKEVEDYMASVKAFGEKLNVTGTPAFIVGQQIVRGYIEYPAFQTIINDERKKSK